MKTLLHFAKQTSEVPIDRRIENLHLTNLYHISNSQSQATAGITYYLFHENGSFRSDKRRIIPSAYFTVNTQ
jgi:hypothetical protein